MRQIGVLTWKPCTYCPILGFLSITSRHHCACCKFQRKTTYWRRKDKYKEYAISVKTPQSSLLIFCSAQTQKMTKTPKMTHFGPKKVHGFPVRTPIFHIHEEGDEHVELVALATGDCSLWAMFDLQNWRGRRGALASHLSTFSPTTVVPRVWLRKGIQALSLDSQSS